MKKIIALVAVFLSLFANAERTIIEEITVDGDNCTLNIEASSTDFGGDSDTQYINRTIVAEFDNDNIYAVYVTSDDLYQTFFINQEVTTQRSSLGADFSSRDAGEDYIVEIKQKAYLNVIVKNYRDKLTTLKFKKGETIPYSITYSDVEMKPRLFGRGVRRVRGSERKGACNL